MSWTVMRSSSLEGFGGRQRVVRLMASSRSSS
jgi:hypothetical protein